MNDTIIFSVFADLHWREGDWTWCEARLDAIIDRAVRSRAEFVIHCGDFCHDVAAAEALLASGSDFAAFGMNENVWQFFLRQQ